MTVPYHTKLGGRKFLLSAYGVTAIVALGAFGADPMSYGAVALVVGAFVGGNAFVEGKHAGTPTLSTSTTTTSTRRDSSGLPVPGAGE